MSNNIKPLESYRLVHDSYNLGTLINPKRDIKRVDNWKAKRKQLKRLKISQRKQSNENNA